MIRKLLLPVTLLMTILISTAMITTDNKTLYDFKANTLEGKAFDFSSLKGKKVLIVNTASECGFTPQYKDLEALYEKYGKDGKFVILGFPCNQFGEQEPGTADTIRSFCTRNYGVTFQLMEKIDVKGEHQHPIYGWLTQKSQNGVEDSEVKWNFNKYLIDETGHVVKYLGSRVTPMDKEITNWIEGK